MKITSSFKNIEHTESLDQKIHEKSQKLKKFFNGNLEIKWFCYVREDGAHCADIHVLGPKLEYRAAAHSDSLYKSFDLVVNKILKQVQKKKDIRRNKISPKKGHSNFREIQIQEQVWDEEYWDERDKDELAS